MTTALNRALEYIRAGWCPVPIPHKGKNPGAILGPKWNQVRITAETAKRYFNGAPQNVGVLLGEPSNGLVDIDLDCSEAIALADHFLPSTRTFGRPSKPRSHWEYRLETPGSTKQFTDGPQGMIVEYRSTGGQTVFPGSTHESGEPITWTDDSPIVTVDADELRRRVAQLAVAVLLVRAGIPEQEAITLAKSERPKLAAVLEGQALSRASSWLGLNAAPAQEARQRGDTGDAYSRARAWLAHVDPAISGQGGHPQLLYAATGLVRGFMLSRQDALSLLRDDYSPRCQPPWSERELAHKVDDAVKLTRLQHSDGRPKSDGWLLEAQMPERPARARRDAPRHDPQTGEVGGPDPNDDRFRDDAPEPEPEPMMTEKKKRKPKGPKRQKQREGWESMFVVNKDDEVKPSVANATLVLEHDDRWSGVFTFDEFANNIVVPRRTPADVGEGLQVPRAWTDADDARALVWLQREYDTAGNGFGASAIKSAVSIVARRHRFHPVRDYLNGLKWDGEPRIAAWLVNYLNAFPTPYSQAVGARWLISAVARVYQPGCKADAMLVLESEQGLGKSTGLRILSEPWFVDEVPDLSSKDSAIQLSGRWIVEWAELSNMQRAEVERVKSFVSRQIDVYRAPYGTRAEEHPRQCVFCGTTNAGTYLRDDTGNRRFWPVAVRGPFLLDELRRDRDQLWAEAVHAYRAGQVWWLDTPDLIRAASDVAEGRFQQDALEVKIKPYLARPSAQETGVQIGDILHDVLCLEMDRWTRGVQMQVASILTRLKWARKQIRTDEGRVWVYLPTSLAEDIEP